MVSGTLALKNGYYYAVLSYQDAAGKRHQKWVSTGLPQKGNKRRAEQELIRIRSEFEIPPAAGELNSNMLFADYLDQWLEVVRARIKPATFGSYQGMVKSTIGPYFRKKELTLKELEAWHIQQFYTARRMKYISALRRISRQRANRRLPWMPTRSWRLCRMNLRWIFALAWAGKTIFIRCLSWII